MLVDIPLSRFPGWKHKRLAEGVYERSLVGLLVDYQLKSYGLLKNDFPFDFEFEFDPSTPESYGVCDSFEQILERWPVLVSSPRTFIIVVSPVRRDEQTPSGGWRWHKWGSYIGARSPEREYLYDEPLIEQVLIFSILEVDIPEEEA